MNHIRPEQFMVAYNEELGVIYASKKGRIKTTTAKHAKALEECLAQYYAGGLSDEEAERLSGYMEDSFREFQDLPVGTVPDILARKVLRRIELLVVNECNLNCRYCYAHGGDYRMQTQKMLPDDAEMYLRSLAVGKYRYVEVVTFFGGEPTLCPDTIQRVCEFFEVCVQDGSFEKMPVFLMVSNGTLIDEKLAQIIHRYHIGVTVSVDGPREINDLLRVDRGENGSFARIAHGIDNLINVGAPPILLEATYTTQHKKMGYTKEDIRKYLIDRFQVQKVMVADCTSGGSDQQLVYNDRDIHTGENGEMMAEEVRYAAGCLRQKEVSPIGCDAGFNSILLMPNGDIYPCHSFIGHSDYKIGTFNDGYFDFSPYEKTLDKLIGAGKFHHARCRDCWAKAVCFSCPGQMLLENDEECIDISCCTRKAAQKYALLKCAENALKRKEVR